MDGILDSVLKAIGGIIYGLLGSPFFGAINIIDSLFRALAGTGTSYSVDGYTPAKNFADGGIVYDLLQADIIKKLIMSIMLLAAFLLIIFTIMAFLKNVYAQKQKTAKEIISNSIKGVLYFVFVPVCTLLGVYLGNIALKAISGATSLGGGTSMAGKLFIACAYDANKWRKSGNKPSEEEIAELIRVARNEANYPNMSEIEGIKSDISAAEYADIVDKVFANSNRADAYFGATIDGFYDYWDINYLFLIVGGIFILYVLCSLAFAMARRIFIMLIWFVISPACCAMFPLDEGKMVGKYKDEMTKQVLSAYGAVAGMNLFMSIMPLIERINLGDIGSQGFIDLFIMICGLLCVKELVGSLSSLVGGEDALAKGSSLMKSSTGALKKYAGGASKKLAGAVGTFRADTKGKKGWAKLGAAAKSIGKHQGLGLLNIAGSAATGINVKDMKKSFKEGFKAEKSENRESMMKEERGKYLKTSTGHGDKKTTTAFGENVNNIGALTKSFKKKPGETEKEAHDRQQYEIGEQVNKAIKGGASHFASQDEVFEALSKETKMSEVELREAHSAYESKHTKAESVRALHGAGLATAEGNYDTAKTKQQEAAAEEGNAKQAVAEQKTAFTGQAADASKNAKDLNIETANVTIGSASSAVADNNFAGAQNMLKGIDLEGVDDEFVAKVRGLISAVDDLIAAEERAKQATATRENADRELASKTEELQRKINDASAAFGSAAKGLTENVEDNLKKIKSMLNQ